MKQPPPATDKAKPTAAKVNYKDTIAKWDQRPRDVAEEIAKKYGPPHEVTDSMLVWHATGPWKRTIVYREEVPHSFPKPHTDIVEQFVDYKAPLGKLDDLARYDGSVVVRRTEGEMSARCDKEEMNLLAINLANDVATGTKTVDQARRTYAETAMAFMEGKKSALTQKLGFALKPSTRDADQPAAPKQAQR